MVADGDNCFRARGIPGGYTAHEIRALLIRGLDLDNDANINIFSLASNPLRPTEQIATLSLSQIPAELSERGEQHINTPLALSEDMSQHGKVDLDSHFDGFTPLHKARDDECFMDIIALGGLDSHAFGSFKAKVGSHMWLRDALPFDIRKSRIFIYGYNTSPNNASFQNIWDLESTFRLELRKLREWSNSTRKPFVIIAHGLGGIIAKAAIIKMAESTINADNAAYRSLRGTLLFGVPSQGMDIESLIPMVPLSEARALLFCLDKHNPATLRYLGENYPKRITQLQDFETFNFYETRESPTAKRNDEGNWEMTGPSTILVTPFSATQGKLRNEPGHRVIALNRTHSEMIKFSGVNDNVYETTLDCLKDIEKRITREGCGWPLHPLSRDEQDCLKSLSFFEQHSREFDPQIKAAAGTCTWIRGHKNYRSWHATNSGLLWIMGPPGAGKSTLMKFMVKTERESQRGGEIIAAFFIHGRGSEKQKSRVGVYQSLLHQILPHCPGHLASLTKTYKERTLTRGSCDSKWMWEEEELQELFVSMVISESRQRPIIVFIDALDEMGEEPAFTLIANLERLHSNDLPRSSRLRLCFSCRYYPNLVEERCLSIAVEKENSRDINSLISTHAATMKLKLSDRKIITDLIIKRANGIFQWVSLVLDEVTHLRRRGQPGTAVISRIKEVPGTLKGIYDALLVFENDHDRKQTLKLFQWILFSSEHLGLDGLRQALSIDVNMSYNTLDQITRNSYYELEDMPLVVHSLSKGLARVTSHLYMQEEGVGCVETIHQSVNDYLLRSGLNDLAQSPTGNPDGLAHSEISRSCIKLLCVIHHMLLLEEQQDKSSDEHEFSDGNEEIEDEEGSESSYPSIHSPDELALVKYAQKQWLNHVIKAERYGIDQYDLLEDYPWQKPCGALPFIFVRLWSERFIFKKSEATLMAKGLAVIFWDPKPYLWDPVHLLALAGIHSALAKMEQVESDIYTRVDSFGQTTLLFALAGGNEKIIASTMSVLAHHHVWNERFIISPLYLAVLHSREDWVRAIISEGADVDQLNVNIYYEGSRMREFSALFAAWERKDEKMIRLLLSAGANPSVICRSRGDPEETVIHDALQRADTWSKSLLLLLVEAAINLYPTKKLPNLIKNRNDSSTLSDAIEQENFLLVQLLFDSGALQDRLGDPQLEDEFAFNTAAACGSHGMVKFLLDNGINPSSVSSGASPLHFAAYHGHSSVVRLLLDAGAHPAGLSLDSEDEYSCLVGLSSESCDSDEGKHWSIFSSSESNGDGNTTPLELALHNGHASVVQAFLDVANTPIIDNKAKVEEIWSLPWDFYIQLAVQGNLPDVVQVLLKSGVDPNTFSYSEKPLLNAAAGEGFIELVRMLLYYGADPTLTDVSGVTALQIAIGNSHLEIISMLLAWRDSHGRTLIMLQISTSEQIAWLPLSARRDRPSWVVKQVLHTDYDFNIQDNKGLTALFHAVIENMPDIVDILLNNGRSDPNMQSLQGETPLMIAASAGSEDILRRLLACPLTNIAIEDEDGLTAIDHARRAGNSTAVSLLRKRQDELLAQDGWGRALSLRAIASTGMMGTLRRNRY